VSDFTVRVRNERQNLRDRIQWLEKGLKEIIKNMLGKPMKSRDHTDAIIILGMARTYLDGEPTTADEFNESQHLEGIELKQELESEYDSDMDEVNAEIAEYDRKYWEEEE